MGKNEGKPTTSYDEKAALQKRKLINTADLQYFLSKRKQDLNSGWYYRQRCNGGHVEQYEQWRSIMYLHRPSAYRS